MRRFIILFVLVAVVMTGLSWADDDEAKIKFNGDFRYRHEMIGKEGTDTRHRERIRARFNITGKVNDDTKVVIGISSGSTDPVSNNQTLTDAFSSKGLLIDLAYFEIKPKEIEGLKLIGGKMKNPFFKPGKSELIWDSDIRQEGVTAGYKYATENIIFNLVGSGFWLEERKADDDAYLAGGQGFLTYNLSEKKGRVIVGGSYFSYGNVQGFPYLYDDDHFGNMEAVDTLVNPDDMTDTTFTDVYGSEYDLFELFGEFSYDFNKVPVTVMGDFVTNSAADSLNVGWLIGFRVGKTKKPGSWDIRYIYRNLEKDAVFGLYSDSDFRGGGTNAKGHEIGGSYQLMESTTFAVSYFNNKLELDAKDQTDYKRWQFDLKFKF